MPATDAYLAQRQIGETIRALEKTKDNKDHLEGAEDLPPVFIKMDNSVAVVLDFFKTVQDHSLKSSLGEGDYQAVKGPLEVAKQKASRLEEIFFEMVPDADTPRQDRYRKAAGKDGRVEELVKAILNIALDLAGKSAFERLAEDHVETLQKGLEEVSKIQPSLLEDQAEQSFHHSGSGSNIINYGPGPQNNNTGSGFQFNGAIKNFRSPPQRPPQYKATLAGAVDSAADSPPRPKQKRASYLLIWKAKFIYGD
ncbi:unnamed protein product [Clonostachys rosea]|uniref:NACHT-NTPase and P-loop NTPases N-terminal domain-containing protein n=1 Tax=Bionectria ochroleuca TaxID=29856 RepID=A0ABY6UZZ2_BIOOC|nr:unnamed protein product [Clonostachys rosea]